MPHFSAWKTSSGIVKLMNAKLFLMTALLGSASILSAAACSSSDDNKPATNTTTDAGQDSGSTTTDSGPTGPTCDDSECGTICKQAAKAACGDQPDIVGTCTQASQLKTLKPDCAGAVDAAINCFKTATFTCKDGKTTTTDCQAELTAAGKCVQGGSSPDGGVDASADGG